MKSKLTYNLICGVLAGAGNFVVSNSITTALCVGAVVSAACFAYYRYVAKSS